MMCTYLMYVWCCVTYGIVCVLLEWVVIFCFFFFKQKTAYEMRISDWSSDVCSSDLGRRYWGGREGGERPPQGAGAGGTDRQGRGVGCADKQIGRASCRERVCQYV